MSLWNPLTWFSATASSGNVGKQSREDIAASYDSAQTTRHNANHWAAADGLNANAAHSPGVRRALRNRSRYSIGSDTVCSGIVSTLTNHTIGTGPKLQLVGVNPKVNRLGEKLWEHWSEECGLAQKLWIMKHTQTSDGECFFQQIGNPKLERIQLDYQLIEADFVTSLRPLYSPYQVDGITYDPQWNPLSYQLIVQRPNDVLPMAWPMEHTVDAKDILHYFHKTRPGQGRGVPPLQSSLELFAVLRRYMLATVSSAEVAANFAAFIESTDGTAIGDDEEGQGNSADDWMTLEIQRNLITNLPPGKKIGQLKPEQPVGNFDVFVKSMIGIIARCINMPLGIAACDSSGYNYSSGRLDHQTYFRSIEIDQSWIAQMVLNPMYRHWRREAEIVLRLPRGYLKRVPHEWHWPSQGSIDPQKDAQSVLLRLKTGQTSISDEQKAGNIGGDVIRENAAYFGISEDEMREITKRSIFESAIIVQGEEPEPQPVKKPSPQPAAARAKVTLTASAKKHQDLKFEAVAANLQIKAAEGAGAEKIPTFSMLAYTGGAMRLDGFKHKIVVDLETAIVASESTPILYEHDPERIVGDSQNVVVGNGQITLTGVFSGVGKDRDKVIAAGKRKFPWQASIGGRGAIDLYDEGEEVECNGRVFAGPIGIARDFELREVSFVSVGADARTTAQVAASAKLKGSVMGFDEWVKSLGFDPAALSDEQKKGLTTEWESKQTQTQTEEGDEDEDAEAAEGDEDAEAEADGDVDGDVDQDTEPKAKAKAKGGRQPIRGAATRGGSSRGTTTRTTRLASLRASEAKELRRVDKIRKLCADSPDIAAKAIERGWSADRAELAMIRATRPKANAFQREENPMRSAIIECSLLLRNGTKEASLEKLDKRYTPNVINAAMERENRNFSFARITGEYLQANGRPIHGGGLDNETIRAALHLSRRDMEIQADGSGGGFSTVSLSGILSNVANKSLLASFIAVPTVSDEFCGMQDMNDFKPATRYRLTMNGKLEKVGATGELKTDSFQEDTWSNQLDTYGKIITLNRQMLINDDLGAFLQIPQLLGRQSALTLEELVFALLLSNPSSFFHSDHANYETGAGSALSITGLTAAVTRFLKQTDKAEKPIVLNPNCLLVPSELKITADQLFAQTNIVAILGAASGAGKLVPADNPHSGKYRPVSSPYLSNSAVHANASGTGWYLLADPGDVPLISKGFLKGQKTPVIENGQTNFDILGFQWRCYFDVGVGLVDYRAGVFNVGA